MIHTKTRLETSKHWSILSRKCWEKSPEPHHPETVKLDLKMERPMRSLALSFLWLATVRAGNRRLFLIGACGKHCWIGLEGESMGHCGSPSFAAFLFKYLVLLYYIPFPYKFHIALNIVLAILEVFAKLNYILCLIVQIYYNQILTVFLFVLMTLNKVMNMWIIQISILLLQIIMGSREGSGGGNGG